MDDSNRDVRIRTDKVTDARQSIKAGTPTPLGKVDLSIARMLNDLAPEVEVCTDADNFVQREAAILQYGPVPELLRPRWSMQPLAHNLAAAHD